MTAFSKTCSGIALVLLLAALGIGPVFFGAVHTSFASLIEALVLAGFLLVLIRALVAGRSIVRDPLDAVLLACWLYVTARYLTSSHEFQSRQEWLMASAAFWVYFSVRSLRSTRWMLPVFGVVLVLVACGVSGYALYQKFSGVPSVLWLASNYPGRVSGTYYCPNHLAGFLEMFIPLLVSIVLFTRLSIAWRLLLVYVLLMLVAAHLYSFSRGGLLSLSAGCAWVFFLGWRHKGAAILILLSIGVLGIFAFIHYLRSSDSLELQRYSSLVHGEWSRVEMWKSAFTLWKQSPWFGIGPMQFDWWHASVRGNVPARAVFVHNDYLQLLTEYGIMGALFFATFLGLALRKLWQGIGRFELLHNTFHHPHVVLAAEEAWRRAAFIGITGSLTALFLHSVVDFNMHIPANALLFALLMGAGHNLCDEGMMEREVGPAAGIVRRVLALCLLPVVLWQGFSVWKTFGGDRRLREAEAYKREMDWPSARAAYRRALDADPESSEAWAQYASFVYQRALLDVPKKREYEREYLSVSEKALELNPLNKLLRIRRGEIFDRMGKFEDAELEYQDAVSFDPTNAYFLNRFGLHYKRWGKKAQARALFDKASRYPGGRATADINLRVLGPIKESTFGP